VQDDHGDGGAGDHIGDEVAHRIDPGAPGVGVSGDDEVVDHLGADKGDGEGERPEQRIAGGIDHPDHADELHQPGEGEHQMRRIFLDDTPDRELRDRAAQEHRRGDAADGNKRNAATDPLVDHLGQRDGHGVENEARGGPDQDEQPEHRDHHPHHEPHVRRGAAAGRELPVVGHHHEVRDAGGNADHGRHQERTAPAEPRVSAAVTPAAKQTPILPQTPLKASVRPRLVAAATTIACRPDDRSQANTPSANSEIASARSSARGSRAAQAAADVEHYHHVAAAPAVGEPAGGQREDAEGEERCRAECEQFGVRPAVDRFEADHHGREDQHYIVVDRVRKVVEADAKAAARLVVGRKSYESCHVGTRIPFRRACYSGFSPGDLSRICNSAKTFRRFDGPWGWGRRSPGQSSVRRKRVTAIVMATSISPANASVS
jgi:hypothetical protein